jgi:hypothetical protein
MGGAPVLDGRHLTGRRNNQPNDSVGGGGGIGEELRASGTRGGLHLLVGLGDKLSGGKNKNRERDQTSDFDGFCWMGGRNNQPKSSRIIRILLGETGAQGVDDGGGTLSHRFSCQIKIDESKFDVALIKRPPIDDCTQQPTK